MEIRDLMQNTFVCAHLGRWIALLCYLGSKTESPADRRFCVSAKPPAQWHTSAVVSLRSWQDGRVHSQDRAPIAARWIGTGGITTQLCPTSGSLAEREHRIVVSREGVCVVQSGFGSRQIL